MPELIPCADADVSAQRHEQAETGLIGRESLAAVSFFPSEIVIRMGVLRVFRVYDPGAMRTGSCAATRGLATLAAIAAVWTLAPVVVGAAEEQPPYPHGTYQEDCSLCHDAASWQQTKRKNAFDHSAHGFPLLGAHATAECRSCHASLDFTATETVCVGCHLDPHESELGTDCERCHTPPASFVDRGPMVLAHRTTRFPLIGSHRVTDCEACHPIVAEGRLRELRSADELPLERKQVFTERTMREPGVMLDLMVSASS